jgi:nanoRNase/pAp phosphatase (c-di-AMP/oligoRNAs hydrolase)
MNFQKFDALLSKLSNKKVLITTHDQVDLDAFASCFLLQYFLKTYYKSIEIHLFFSHISNFTFNFISKIKNIFPDIVFIEEINKNYQNVEFLLILDTNNINQVALPETISKDELNIPFIFIDHHFASNINLANNWGEYNIIFDKKTSTAEIIFDIFTHYQTEIPIHFKYLLLAAIYTDTGGFKFANSETFHNISTLLNENIDYQEFLSYIEKKSDFSKKLAIIKGLQRVEIIRVHELLIGLSHVSSYTSSVASVMLQIGFDVSIVYSKTPSHYRITTRAKKEVCLQTGLHLGKILSETEEGNGGGHDGAASLNGENSFDAVLSNILAKIKKTLNTI